MRRYVAVLLFFLASSACESQGGKSTSFHGGLPQALLFVDQTFHVSVLGELVDPIPINVSVQVGPKSTAHVVLEEIVAQCPGYVVLPQAGVFIVAQKQVLRDSANPMNQILKDYQVPGNLNLFKLSFPSAVAASEEGVSGIGGMINGFSAPGGVSVPLRVERLRNLTAREILTYVAKEVGNLYSVLVLPCVHPEKEKHEHATFRAWEIVGGGAVAQYNSQLSGYRGGSIP